ncbi:helicase-exonuclease AddAB subunit AddA [Vaginisenegalia massiliensis]|uniref:helicase-exonuclease AddAB subunit AddA n=1 Tax=Vaginisenegalia massiliensis TaxID=2058294 RepID=UPI001F14C4A8|nr:helicase-exonuclease AddAB subunit AddA [Vaginisenegalia massiliensis]
MSPIPAKPSNVSFNDQQWEAIHARGNNILVSASAGSGKTTVLIERIMNHIVTGFANIDQLLVCTFTEMAAKEMKERMEVKLKQTISQTSDPVLQAHLLKQLQLLPNAHIRTLHSFCLQVIQEYFYLIDFNPSFRLQTDETQLHLIYETIWEQMLTDIFTGIQSEPYIITKEDYVELLAIFGDGKSDIALFNLILRVYQFSCAHPEPLNWLRHFNQASLDIEQFSQSPLYQEELWPLLTSSLRSALGKIEQINDQMLTLSEASYGRYHPVIQDLQSKLEGINQVLQSNDLSRFIEQLQAIQFEKWPSNSKKSDDYESVQWLKEQRDEVKASLERLKKYFSYSWSSITEIEGQISQQLELIKRLVEHFISRLTAYKRQENLLDYNDLEHLTLDILAPFNSDEQERKASLAAHYFQDLFAEVLVDEYQDINEIQANILAWLSHEKRPELVPNLFMVGDVKQSIYGFRMAEPSLFMAKYDTFSKGQDGHLINLDRNYRSRHEVLHFTNSIFSRLMDKQFGQMDYGQAEALKTGNHSFEPTSVFKDFKIDLLLFEKEQAMTETDTSTENEDEFAFDQSIEAQAYMIAQDINQRMARQELIYDKQSKQLRPLEFKDIVILSSTRSVFLPIQQAFQALQIPLMSQKVENYFQRQEIRLLIALLKLIDNPIQDIPLVAVLRSYFVGLSDNDLATIRLYQKEGSYYQACLNFCQKGFETQAEQFIQIQLQTLLNRLNHWRHLANQKSIVELIWTIYEETHYLDYVSGLSNSSQRLANLHAFYSKAQEFEEAGFRGLFSFLNYIEQVLQHQRDLAEPVILENDQNFVRMMTVHASKGLEFPCVYLMNLEKKFNLRDLSHQRLICSKNYGVGCDYYRADQMLKFDSLIKTSIKLAQEKRLKAEEMRKLYVALTRCEQKLILVGTIDQREKWLAKIEGYQKNEPMNKTSLARLEDRQNALSWLEWIQLAYAVDQCKPLSQTPKLTEQMTIRIVSASQLQRPSLTRSHKADTKEIESWIDTIIDTASQPIESTVWTNKLRQLNEMKYPYQLATATSSYQSVSELKRLYEEPSHEKLAHFEDRRFLKEDQTNLMKPEGIQSIRYTQDSFEAPSFMQEDTNLAAKIGTLTHYLMQHIDLKSFQLCQGKGEFEAQLAKQVKELATNHPILFGQTKLINLDQVVAFLQSDFGQFIISQADNVKREVAFSYIVPASLMFQKQLEESQISQVSQDDVLIHGVVDGYLIYQNQIYLWDFKTDRQRPLLGQDLNLQMQEIVDKYRFQISLYAQALQVNYQRPVKSAKLILLDFNQSIEVTNRYNF